MTEIVVEQRVAAPPATVYRYLTDSTKWALWQGPTATIDARAGGIFSIINGKGMNARGQFVELEQDRRVVFTWGWVDQPGIPPGSTTVEIELVEEATGTLIILSHRELPETESALHQQGWQHYLPRLALVASGKDPGPEVDLM
ncbi:MAG: SRPBCC family protein [Acidimicrobiia bacterium]